MAKSRGLEMVESTVWIVFKKYLQYEEEQFEKAYLDFNSAKNYVAAHVSELKEGEHFTTSNYTISPRINS